MKKFGDYLQEWLYKYQKNNPKETLQEEIRQDPPLVLMNNWEKIVDKIPEEQFKSALTRSAFVSMKDKELVVRGVDSSAKFVVKMMEQSLVEHINKEMEGLLQRSLEEGEKIKKINFLI